MTQSRGTGTYALLLRLYPRHFRQEYGPDMTLLFSNQLNDETASRIWGRALVDLAISVPTRHLEAHMNRSPSPIVPILFAVVSVAGMFIAVVGGSNVGMLAVGLSVAAVAGVLAGVSLRQIRPFTERGATAAHWWKFLVAGGAVIGTVATVTTATGELSSGWWVPMMLTLLTGLLLAAAGVVLGLVRLIGHHPGATGPA